MKMDLLSQNKTAINEDTKHSRVYRNASNISALSVIATTSELKCVLRIGILNNWCKMLANYDTTL